jgi:hypothetical protein
MVRCWALFGSAETALYRGDGFRARDLISREQEVIRRSSVVEVRFIHLTHLQARAALTVAVANPNEGFFSTQAQLLRSAARDARRIAQRKLAWSSPLEKLIRGGIANLRGKLDEAVVLLDTAEKELLTADMELYAAAARRQRGKLIGGDEGQLLVRSADEFMAGQDIRNPARIAAMLVPGFPD